MRRVIAFACAGLTVDDIDVFEINEAFASQVTDRLSWISPSFFFSTFLLFITATFTIFLGCVLCGKTGHSYGESES